jgi:Protein of unknown function (DUF2911)
LKPQPDYLSFRPLRIAKERNLLSPGGYAKRQGFTRPGPQCSSVPSVLNVFFFSLSLKLFPKKPSRRYTSARRLSIPMSATIVWRAVLISLLWAPCLAAQSGSAATSTTTCNLDDGRQVYVRYVPVPNNKEKVSNGKPWAPGGVPMTLFTEAQLSFGSSLIPVGAYTVYPIPARGNWTLVVNKNVTAGAAYDEKQDIARSPMESAQVEQPSEALEVAFAHVGPRCTLRVYIGKTASFADFTAK